MNFNRLIWLNHRDIMHPKAGGAERTIYEVSSRLVKRGYEVILLSSKFENLSSYQEVGGVKIIRLGGDFTSHVKNIIFERKFKTGTVVIDDMAHVVPWGSERFTSLPGTVFFRHLHRRTLDGQLSPMKATILKTLEQNYSRLYKTWPFITESKQGVEDLIEIGIPKERIVRIPPGVDFENLRPKQKFETPSLVYFGGMRDYKRPYDALYLVQKLRSSYPKIKLRIIGNGPSLESMKLLAKKLQVRSNVEFLGRLEEIDLFDIVSKSWLNLHFSFAEGWGYSILESAACGTPTLAYNAPGVNEAISDGRNGLKVPSDQKEKLLQTATEILSNYQKWIQSSRSFAENYSWNTTTDLFERHLSTLL